MVLEIIECVIKVSMKIYETVDEVQANKKRCQRLADRIRCLVAPLNTLVVQGDNGAIYKEALIDLVSTLEEARQFLNSFLKEKSVLKKVHDACYASRVKEKFEYLNERLNDLVPALTFGLQVEYRQSVQKTFSFCKRIPEDTKDESLDLKDIHTMLNSLGMPSFQYIRVSELKEMRELTQSELYNLYSANYRMTNVVVKKPKFDLTKARREVFLNDAKNMLRFNSENVVRVFGICLDSANSYVIVVENMHLGTLHKVLQSDRQISKNILLRMCLETSKGLYFVHCCDVIHRNLSSSKYLVNNEMHVKIAGFEFAVTESTVSMSKDNFANCSRPHKCLDAERPYTEKSDVFRYGFILCELITRRDTSHCQFHADAIFCNKECLEALETEHDLNEVIGIARKCLRTDKMLRPSMEDVVVDMTSLIEQDLVND